MRRCGETLVELLVALFVLGLVLAGVMQSLADGLRTVDRLRRMDACQYGAQWWLSRLPRPVGTSGLAAMPRSAWGLSFDWETGNGELDTFRLTLTVRAADASLTLRRTF